jgi:nicotinate-nucleotide adenylyltransferase
LPNANNWSANFWIALKEMARIGLYFGSFNPIHNGHIRVAQYIRENGSFEEIWFVPSPLNPLKSEETLIPAHIRLNWVQKALKGVPGLSVSDLEFHLPIPSYTFQSAQAFVQQFPEHEFALIMGADNLHGFHRWQHAEELSLLTPIHVYARPGFPKPEQIPLPYNAIWYDAPLLGISATQIRESLWNDDSINAWVPKPILSEVTEFFAEVKP